MQEALDFNQGSIIEPIYMSTSQAYRDSDEIDNTVATPELMRPLALGADIVVQSVSKTLNTTGYASGQSIPAIS